MLMTKYRISPALSFNLAFFHLVVESIKCQNYYDSFQFAFLLPRFLMFPPVSDLTAEVPNCFDVSWSKRLYYPYHSLALCIYLFPYLLRLPLFISPLSLVLALTNSTYHACRHVLCLLSCCNDSITARHLPLTSKPPSDTSTSQSWYSALTFPARTWQLSPYPEGWIYETNVWTKLGSPR